MKQIIILIFTTIMIISPLHAAATKNDYLNYKITHANKKLIKSVFNKNPHQLERALKAGANAHIVPQKGYGNLLLFLCEERYQKEEDRIAIFTCIHLLLEYGAVVLEEHVMATFDHNSYLNGFNPQLFKLFVYKYKVTDPMYFKLVQNPKTKFFLIQALKEMQIEIHFFKLRISYEKSALINAITQSLPKISEQQPYLLLPLSEEIKELLGLNLDLKRVELNAEINTELD